MVGRQRALRGRLWAVSLCLPLVGCTQGGGLSPIGESLAGLWGPPASHHREQAEALPYASLLLNMEGNTALVVLAYAGGEADAITLWQARDGATLELREGRPYRTAGFDTTLLFWSASPAQRAEYQVESAWRDAHGLMHLAQGQARLTCEPPNNVELPLTTLPLIRCVEAVRWSDGTRSRNLLWQDEASGRLWAGEVAPWPGADPIRWQVARPWWSE